MSSSQQWYPPRNNTSCSKRGKIPAGPGLPKGSAGPSSECFWSAALEGPRTGGWEADWLDVRHEKGARMLSSPPHAVRRLEPAYYIHGDSADGHHIGQFSFPSTIGSDAQPVRTGMISRPMTSSVIPIYVLLGRPLFLKRSHTCARIMKCWLPTSVQGPNSKTNHARYGAGKWDQSIVFILKRDSGDFDRPLHPMGPFARGQITGWAAIFIRALPHSPHASPLSRGYLAPQP